MYPGNTEPITVCREVYQINQALLKSVSTSSVLSWYMGNLHRSVPLMLPSTRIHKYIRTCVMYCVGCTLYTWIRCILQVAIFLQSHRYDEEYEVDLKKDSGGLGIEIAGVEHEGLQGIVISSIVVGGPADKTKKMRIGDQILRVNGWDTTVYVLYGYVHTYVCTYVPCSFYTLCTYVCTYMWAFFYKCAVRK